jgi:hypothetical protein
MLLTEPIYYHLWFIYMLIVLYLFAPAAGSFLNRAQQKHVWYLIALWFFWASLLPIIDKPLDFQTYFTPDMNDYSPLKLSGYFLLGYNCRRFKTCQSRQLHENEYLPQLKQSLSSSGSCQKAGHGQQNPSGASHPHLRILVGDAVRPLFVQKEMWKLVAGTTKQPYVANPQWGSMHNYGAAVDVTLFDVQTGKQLDMGTPLDYFGPLAQPLLEDKYLRNGELNVAQVENRHILRDAMQDAGWHSINIEWWHFNAFPKADIRRNYSMVK